MINKRSNRLHAIALCAVLSLGLGYGQAWGSEGKTNSAPGANLASIARQFLCAKSLASSPKPAVVSVETQTEAEAPKTWSISNVGWSMAQTILTSSFSYCLTRVYFFKTHLSNAASLAQSLTLAQSPEEAAIIQTRLATALVKQDAIEDPEGIETNQRILLLIEYSRFKDPEFLPFARKIYEQKLKQKTSSEPQDFAAFKKRYNQQHAESLKQVAAQEKAPQQPSNLKTAKA